MRLTLEFGYWWRIRSAMANVASSVVMKMRPTMVPVVAADSASRPIYSVAFWTAFTRSVSFLHWWQCRKFFPLCALPLLILGLELSWLECDVPEIKFLESSVNFLPKLIFPSCRKISKDIRFLRTHFYADDVMAFLTIM